MSATNNDRYEIDDHFIDDNTSGIPDVLYNRKLSMERQLSCVIPTISNMMNEYISFISFLIKVAMISLRQHWGIYGEHGGYDTSFNNEFYNKNVVRYIRILIVQCMSKKYFSGLYLMNRGRAKKISSFLDAAFNSRLENALFEPKPREPIESITLSHTFCVFDEKGNECEYIITIFIPMLVKNPPVFECESCGGLSAFCVYEIDEVIKYSHKWESKRCPDCGCIRMPKNLLNLKTDEPNPEHKPPLKFESRVPTEKNKFDDSCSEIGSSQQPQIHLQESNSGLDQTTDDEWQPYSPDLWEKSGDGHRPVIHDLASALEDDAESPPIPINHPSNRIEYPSNRIEHPSTKFPGYTYKYPQRRIYCIPSPIVYPLRQIDNELGPLPKRDVRDAGTSSDSRSRETLPEFKVTRLTPAIPISLSSTDQVVAAIQLPYPTIQSSSIIYKPNALDALDPANELPDVVSDPTNELPDVVLDPANELPD